MSASGLSKDVLTLVRFREKDDYQKRPAAYLAEECRRLDEASVVAVDLLALPKEFGRLYFLSNQGLLVAQNLLWRVYSGAPKLACVGWGGAGGRAHCFWICALPRILVFIVPFRICCISLEFRLCCSCRCLWFFLIILGCSCGSPLTNTLSSGRCRRASM